VLRHAEAVDSCCVADLAPFRSKLSADFVGWAALLDLVETLGGVEAILVCSVVLLRVELGPTSGGDGRELPALAASDQERQYDLRTDSCVLDRQTGQDRHVATL